MLPNLHIIPANILTAYQPETVGTKVVDADGLNTILQDAVRSCDFNAQRVPGQAVIQLPDAACKMVSAGVGPKSLKAEDYVVRTWRGAVSCYLRRQFAAPVTAVKAVIYTREAYISDPQVAADPQEMARVHFWNGFQPAPTHVLVALLASAGPDAPLSAGRFVANLAGGNKEALVWTADEIRAKAREIIAYQDAWSVVSD